ncbi:MAG TPA: PilZ domain-containing protein [Bryobacteraceae bacterium]|nr:PilZ domain-containing protein [Bryobacteraceae bacterium]
MRGPQKFSDCIAGERRRSRRYVLELPLQWKLVHRRRVVESGSGRTRDLSSQGLLFEAEKSLEPGGQLDISVAWPALLDGVAPLKLCVTGAIIRSGNGLTAIRIMQHEFRTAGISAMRVASASNGASTFHGWNLHLPASVTKIQ